MKQFGDEFLITERRFDTLPFGALPSKGVFLQPGYRLEN
jgi:hypothetical protein